MQNPLKNLIISPNVSLGNDGGHMKLNASLYTKKKKMKCSKHSDGRFHCVRVDRVRDALKYLSKLDIENREWDRQSFKCFVQKIYVSLLADYCHIFKEHGDVKKLKNAAHRKPDSFPLHSFGVQNGQQFRERDYLRRMMADPEDMSFWCDLLNSMHCHLFHHRDMGIRIKYVDRQSVDDENLERTREMSKWNDLNFQFIKFLEIDPFGVYIFIRRSDPTAARIDAVEDEQKQPISDMKVTMNGKMPTLSLYRQKLMALLESGHSVPIHGESAETTMKLLVCTRNSDGKFECDRVNRVVDFLSFWRKLDLEGLNNNGLNNGHSGKHSKQQLAKLFYHFVKDNETHGSLLEDFCHIFKEHGDVKKVKHLVQSHCEEPNCLYRMFTEQQRLQKAFGSNEGGSDIMFKSFFTDIIDTMHCHLFHLYDMGIRIKFIDLNGEYGENREIVYPKRKEWEDRTFQFARKLTIDRRFEVYIFAQCHSPVGLKWTKHD